MRFRFHPVASRDEKKQRKPRINPAIPNEIKIRKSNQIILFILLNSRIDIPSVNKKINPMVIAGEVKSKPSLIGLALYNVVIGLAKGISPSSLTTTALAISRSRYGGKNIFSEKVDFLSHGIPNASLIPKPLQLFPGR